MADDLTKLVSVATDLGHSAEIRIPAIKLIRNIRTHEALLALLDLVANEKLTRKERELALKLAGDMVKSSR